MNFRETENINALSELLDDAPALIAILNGPQHVFGYANKMYLTSIGKTKDIIGNPISEVMPELKTQGIFELLDKVYKTGEPYKISELPVYIDIHRNGQPQEIFFNFIYKPIRNGSEEITGIFVHALDITELVTAKKAALHSKDEFHDMIMNAPVATAVYAGKDMIIELANDKMVALWGKEDSVIGTKLADALPELDGQPFLQLLDEVFTTGITYNTNEQKCLLNVDGLLRTFWFNFSYKPLFDSNGKVYAIINMAIDVTHQVEAKRKLAEAEEKLRTAIESANLGTWDYYPISGKVEMNERMIMWRGLKKDNITIDDTLNTTTEKDEVRRQLLEAMNPETGGIVDIEFDVINAETGEKKHLHSQGKAFFDDENKPFLVTGITQDITLQKINEMELEDKVTLKTAELANVNNDLIQLNANLEQFVYIASHDLQEPLRKINIFSDMLQKSSSDINDEGKMYISKIEKAAKRMSLLINNLLEFSQISSKEKVFVSTDLNEIINNIKVDYELLIKQKNASLEITSLPVIEAIPLQMNQLFYNLIGNALKFAKADEPSVIRIGCKMLTEEEIKKLKLQTGLSYCNISVQDNGIGFDQKYSQQIFEIFQRLHGKQEYAGTGIGLSLARKITDNHGGTIFATSEETKGALFNVILPVIRN